MLKFIRFNSLIGEIGVVWDEKSKLLKQVILPERSTNRQNPSLIAFHGVIEETSPNKEIFRVMSDIKDVILGKEVTFDINRLDFSDMTEFQRKVLTKQSEIPYGKVITYKKLAQMIDKPKSARPVANVLSNNLFPLVIPCHRTVRSDWTVGGYAGSNDGYYKRFILEHEGIKIVDDVISKEYRYLEDDD
ncbi:MAG TPA: methylated-DNA--[protein]-cysteine S-methyltransferase [Methanosphaera sp.]|nr:methylated-DNA--[protein]-cysteine S-methyltransferase [Methanosphaera sp.]